MAQLHINTGTTDNDGTGDVHRVAFQKCESNFNELYSTMDSGIGEAPIDGQIYGRKDADWEVISGGTGTTPTLQQVTDEGNETTNGIAVQSLIVTSGDSYRDLSGDEMAVCSFGGSGQKSVSFQFEDTAIELIKDVSDVGKQYKLKDSGVGVATLAFESDVPTTATDLDALKRDGSNANSDLDIGGFTFNAKSVKFGGADKMEVRGDNINTPRIAQWQDKDYTGIADYEDIINELVTFKTDNYLDATSSIQSQLDSKQEALSFTPYKFLQTSQTAHTGTLSETIIATDTIVGGTFNSSDIMKVIFKATKGATTSNVTMRLRINTSNTLTGATQIGLLTFTTANLYAKMKRDFDLQGGNLYGYNFSSSLANDDTNVNTTPQSTTYNTANTLYFFWTLQLGTSGDSVTPNLVNLTN